MSKQKSMNEITAEFRSDMQKISDESGVTISVGIAGEKMHTIAEPQIDKTDSKKTKKSKEFLQYKFTHDEIHQKGQDLARIASEIEALKEEKKAAVASFNAKITAGEADVSTLGKHINNGYEYRYIECTTIFHHPNTGMKTTFRDDTNEIVKKESMDELEMQGELQFEDI